MQENQKTLDSFDEENRTESEGNQIKAMSTEDTHSLEEVTYDNLIDAVVSKDNVGKALKQVVGNKGAPGTDGMSVSALKEWLDSNFQTFCKSIKDGQYIPTPVRRKEIPKPNGGVRNLGIPTVKDRLVQQMIAQILSPIYDPLFSDSSFGFRPGRSAQEAIMCSKEYYGQGYTVVVDLDLEKFFDTLNQRFLMNVLRERIKDKVLIQLIKRFLRAGVVMQDGVVMPTPVGSPQGGPLSPLLSNIYLDKLDKELERRNLRFCRYADDVQIYVRSQRAGERVFQSITKFLEEELLLKVNRTKSEVGSPLTLKFLGFNLSYGAKHGTGINPSPSSLDKFKREVRSRTKRNRGIGLKAMLEDLNAYVRGWTGYYGLTTSKRILSGLDKWIRRRVRQYVIKQWKRKYTKFINLRKMCPSYLKYSDNEVSTEWIKQCWNGALIESYWKASKHKTISTALSNRWLEEQGLVSIMDESEKVKERIEKKGKVF